MSILSVKGNATLGIQQGLDGMRKNAAQIAGSDQLNKAGKQTDLAGSLIELKENQVQVQASAKVVSEVDKALGTLLDTRA